jgi:hypothetical protein
MSVHGKIVVIIYNQLNLTYFYKPNDDPIDSIYVAISYNKIYFYNKMFLTTG